MTLADARPATATRRQRSFWGWGWADLEPTRADRERLAATVARRFGVDGLVVDDPPTIEDLDLPEPRVSPPPALAHLVTTDTFERASHTWGKGFVGVLRGFRGEFPHPPDLVAHPRTEADVAALLDWCSDARVAAIPYGAGSSVVGGTDPDVGDAYAGTCTIDLRELDRVVEVDAVSRAARVQGGVYGPDLDTQLRPHGLTLRHFPQSYELSTLGGWIATRSGGHYATNHTHVDDFVESLRAVTPRGVMESRRLPGSGAGPSPDRLLIGSEGALGVITEAWVRVQARPVFRASAAVRFARYADGVQACRAVVQSGLWPSNCRLLDPGEAEASQAGDGSASVLIVGFESADHPLGPWIARAVELCRDHGGTIDDAEVRVRGGDGGRDADAGRAGAEDAWRQAFLAMPYQINALAGLGLIVDTFETAVTWDRFEAFDAGVRAAMAEAIQEVGAPGGLVTCRFTHVYPDGPAPYYTFRVPGRRGAEIEQWQVLKAAASDAVVGLGGTITHHHAVGRLHRPWYDRQRPDLFAEALRAAKRTLDPAGVCNPGVLVDP